MLKDKIQNDLKKAQLERSDTKVSTLRLLLSEIRNAEIEKNIAVLSEADIILVIQREVKKRKEGAAGFRSGSREDQVQKEEAEQKILEGYLPAQISNEELTKIVEDTITEEGVTSVQDMGKVMGKVMAKVSGRADGSMVSSIVKEKLNG